MCSLCFTLSCYGNFSLNSQNIYTNFFLIANLLNAAIFHAFNCYHAFLAVDKPDPYVKLLIPTSPQGFCKTTSKSNTADPVWDEDFSFILDPKLKNILSKSELMARILFKLMGLSWCHLSFSSRIFTLLHHKMKPFFLLVHVACQCFGKSMVTLWACRLWGKTPWKASLIEQVNFTSFSLILHFQYCVLSNTGSSSSSTSNGS